LNVDSHRQPAGTDGKPSAPDPDGLYVALTPGEPAGVGPELALRLAGTTLAEHVVVVADPQLLEQRAQALGMELRLRRYHGGRERDRLRPNELRVWPVELAAPVTCGRPDTANAPYVLACLQQACDACRRGEFAAMVTGPVDKGLLRRAGIAFRGHTEYLAARCAAPTPVMLLVHDTLRVALVTTHLPLAEVPAAVTAPRLQAVLEVLHRGLRCYFGIAAPRITVCGLNPHAGEGGTLGRAEQEIIAPVLHKLRERGMELTGPAAADTAFTAAGRGRADAILAMYHDQGLTAIKALGFGDTVNLTLGLPILRTSVDHGVALDLAGSGRANADSLRHAVTTALQLAGTAGLPIPSPAP